MKSRKWIVILFLFVLSAILVSTVESENATFREVDGGYEILVGNQIVGGVERYEINGRDIKLTEMIQNAGIFDFDESEVDFYMLESAKYGDWLLTFGTTEKSIRHEMFLRDSYFYDFWIEETSVRTEQLEEITLVFVENILPLLS